MELVMNKKGIIITISVVLIIAVVAVLIFSNSYPENGEEIAAGSIGKVDKYREATIQGYDIELRTDFIKDDSKVKQFVKDLTRYYITLKRLSGVLGSIDYSTFCSELPDNNAYICDKLMDLKEFVDNDTEKLKNSITTFSSAYKNDDPPKSDVENQMIQIADMHIQFLKKNNILNQVIKDIDRVLDDPQNAQKLKNKNDIIEIRDILLITNLEISSIIGDKENFEFATNSDLKNPKIMKDISQNTLKSKYIIEGQPINIEGLITLNIGYQESQGNLNIQTADVEPPIVNLTEELSIVSGGSSLEIIVVESVEDLKSIDTKSFETSIVIVVGAGEELNSAVKSMEGLDFLNPGGIYSIAQVSAQTGVENQDVLKALSQGNLNVYSSEAIIKGAELTASIGENLSNYYEGIPSASGTK
jgi:hypothetical protein